MINSKGRKNMNRERKSIIRELIEKNGRMSLDELDARFTDVSEMTLRRDLYALEEEGVLIRVRGGAVSVHELQKKTEEQFDRRTAMMVGEKRIIAEKAIKFLEAGTSIFIDSGSTTLYFAKEMPDMNYYISTNGISIAAELLRKKMPSVTLIGGEVSRNNLATSGHLGLNFLASINIETAFMSATAFNFDKGFSCASQSEAELKSTVLSKVKKRIMLLDCSKVDKTMPYTFAKTSDIDYLVTDGGLPDDIKYKLSRVGVNVL